MGRNCPLGSYLLLKGPRNKGCWRLWALRGEHRLVQGVREPGGRGSCSISVERHSKNVCLSTLDIEPDTVDINLSPASNGQ